MTCICHWFARHTGAFQREERGAIAIIFGVIAIPLLCVIGGALDMSIIMQKRQQVQSITDLVAGASVEILRQDKPDEAFETGEQMLQRMIASGKAPRGKYDITVNQKERFVEVSGRAKTDTFFLALIGFDKMNYSVVSRKYHQPPRRTQSVRKRVRVGRQLVEDREQREELLELIDAVRSGDTSRLQELRDLVSQINATR